MCQSSNNKSYLLLTLVFMIIYLTCLVKVWPTTSNLSVSEIIDLEKIKFENYLLKFNKSYSGHEYDQRLINFKASLAEIARLNNLEGATVYGLTKFADMSNEEFLSRMTPKATIPTKRKSNYKRYECEKPVDESLPYYDNSTIPDKFDWRIQGYVSPVLDQDTCLACWAMSAVGIIETMAAKRSGSRKPLSVQEVIDCIYNYHCGYGNLRNALEYLYTHNVSILSEDQYPLALKNQTCMKRLLTEPGVKVKCFDSYNNIEEKEILRLVSHQGPVATILDPRPLRLYINGIIRWSCRQPSEEKHVLQIIGYDNIASVPFYILKNSWGTTYGDQGYIKVAIGHNVCGIRQYITALDVITDIP